MIYTTLNKIKDHDPCENRWEKLLGNLNKYEPDDESLSFKTILDSNGLRDAIWALRAVEDHCKEIVLFAVACTKRAQHLITDKQSLDALDVAEKYVRGECSKDELDAAARSAWNAAWNAELAAQKAARYAQDVAQKIVQAAAWNAVWETTLAAQMAAQEDAVEVSWAAQNAAQAAAAANDAEIDWQTKEFIRFFCAE